MDVVFKSGEESLEILLSQFALQYLLIAGFFHQSLHLVDIDVSILVDIDFLSEEFLKILFRLEFILKVSIHFDHLLLNYLKFVSWDFLAIQDSEIVIEHIFLCHRSEV